jgi:hypothetical protein
MKNNLGGAEWAIKYSGLYTPNISACSKCEKITAWTEAQHE